MEPYSLARGLSEEFFSIVLMEVCDAHYVFTLVKIGVF